MCPASARNSYAFFKTSEEENRIFPSVVKRKREQHALRERTEDVHLSKTRESLSLREEILFILLFDERDCVSSKSDFFVLFVFFFFTGRTRGAFRRQIVVVVVIVWKNVYDDDCGCGGERSASNHASSSSSHSSSVFRTTNATKTVDIHPNAIDAQSLLSDVSAWETGPGRLF